MERFAFKIDAALKANLYKICRLCGIDNPSKVPIITNESDVIDLDEPSLGQKIYELVGFMVAKNDKMPQTMCSLCVDKINDFYEFREMCYATNKQTRKLLGLKQADPEKLIDIKPIFKTEPLSVDTPVGKRGRKRKTDDSTTAGNSSGTAKSNATEIALEVKSEPIAWRKKQRLQQHQQLTASKTEIKKEPMETDNLKNKTALLDKRRCKASCSVCGERFLNKELAEEHKIVAHVPSIVRYYCYACNQNHNSLSDIKAHQLWHKLSKTPYQCPLCDANVANNYAFSRHMREHTPPTPMGLLVLDRECALCKKTFLTNFFFNTHPCARRTRKCGGCNRQLSSEVGYMRHAPFCAKIYLNHSKHILPEVAESETHFRIKNEHGADAEEDALPTTGFTQEKGMQPVVVLERLASPLLRAVTVHNSVSRASDRVSSKKYLKRVDQLLKNTMSTLVSIKHEPEVHINDTGPPLAAEQPESEPEGDAVGYDDWHGNAANDDSDEDEHVNAAADVSTVAVKQEQIEEACEAQQTPENENMQVKQEPLKLKLKITNNHGQLNSSIVDEDNDLQMQARSSKKKKKRKHKERNKESQAEGKAKGLEQTDATAAEVVAAVEAPTSPMVTIKQERVDDSYPAACGSQSLCEPQATVMTSIPMPQINSSYSEADQESDITEQEPQDVKPNRLELDRLMQITHIAGGVALAEEAMPPENALEALPNESQVKIPANPSKPKSTARKSTGGTTREPATSSSSTSAQAQVLPQIVAVESAVTLPFNLLPIKSEPVNRGYADEHEKEVETDAGVQAAAPADEDTAAADEAATAADEATAVAAEAAAPADEATAEAQQSVHTTNEINHNEKINEEAAYIRTLDLNNLNIKQEKDLHISDVDINDSEAENMHYNGLHESENSEGDEDDDSASSADEAEEDMDTFDQEEERIYREIELPPLEEQSAIKETALETQNDTEMLPITEQSVSEEQPLTDLDAPTVQSSSLTQAGLESQNDADMIVAQNPSSSAIESSLEQSQKELELPQSGAQGVVEIPMTILETEHQELAAPNDSEMQHSGEEEPLPQSELEMQHSGEEELQPQSELELPQTEAQDAVETTMAMLETEQQEVVAQNDSEMQHLEQEHQPQSELELPQSEAEGVVETPMTVLETEQLEVPAHLEMQHSGVEERPQNPSSAPNFSFVITSVCSQAEEAPLPVDEPENAINVSQTPEQSVNRCEENIKSPVLTLSTPKDNETLAQPFFDSPGPSSNYNCDEEQQNVLNHELSATVEQVQIINVDQPSAVVAEPDVANEAGPSTSGSGQNVENSEGPSANEETENLINEQQQQQMQQDQQLEQLQQRCQMNDDSNINEIAENNNNANIERELQDDAHVAQENSNVD